MVKKLFIFLAFILFFLMTSIYHAPKENIYFALEQELKKNNIIISNEKIEDTGFSLKLQDAELFYDSINSASIKEIDINLLLFKTSVTISDIQLSQMASSFLPLKIRKLILTHSIFNPLSINIYESGGNGKIRGNFSLIDKKLHIVFSPSKLMLNKFKKSIRIFKKSKNGNYTYDKSF